MRSCVVIPTYNEKENIAELIERVLKNDVDIVIVDDSSPDGTGEIVKSIIKDNNDDRVKLLTRKDKLGLGKAYVNGFKVCIESKYDIICQMDADLSHDPEALLDLIEPVKEGGVDLVIGSRYVPGGSIPKWTLLRRLLSRGGNIYTRLMLNMKVKDATGGFRVYNANFLKKMLDVGIDSDGYGFQIEMTYCASKLGAVILEKPISFSDRQKGNSKMGGSIVIEALSKVTLWSMRDHIWIPFLRLIGHKSNKAVDKNTTTVNNKNTVSRFRNDSDEESIR